MGRVGYFIFSICVSGNFSKFFHNTGKINSRYIWQEKSGFIFLISSWWLTSCGGLSSFHNWLSCHRRATLKSLAHNGVVQVGVVVVEVGVDVAGAAGVAHARRVRVALVRGGGCEQERQQQQPGHGAAAHGRGITSPRSQTSASPVVTTSPPHLDFFNFGTINI